MPALISFDEALGLQPERARRTILLGNGFSIACRPEIFTYGALFDRADFDALDEKVRAAFDVLGSRDFEHVMRSLQTASRLATVYAPADPELSTTLSEHAEALRDVLVRAIATSHPEHPFQIEADEYTSARTFLSHFNRIYSLSYDLLLYWTAMQEMEPALAFDDGFRTPDDGPAEYVTWEVEKTDTQNAFYLHGALHLFDAGHEIKKFTWANTGVRLIEQVRDALEENLFPLIVSEGEAEQKLDRINHSNYLARGYRSFAKIGHALYTFGVAFSDNDDHLLHLVRKNRRLAVLAIGIYGDPNTPENRRMIEKIENLNNNRSERNRLLIRYFDAETARAWNRGRA
ncbi:DUF4917 family protein [Gaopeijia maritima]|uniref:DUF4917 family protein n=1 Tax=Gaopeijia maritima TaxID=3119007 RepID=A0ABU9EAC5_9BACT